MFGIEPQPLHAQFVTQLERRALDEVRHGFALFLVEMLTVFLARCHHRLEPLVGAWFVPTRGAHRISDRVVVGDRVFGFILRVAFRITGVVSTAVLQQRRIENRLLGVGMRVETHAQDIPHRRELVLGLGVVEPEKLTTQPIVVGVNEVDDVSHARKY